MARREADDVVTQSVLERLIDHDPSTPADPPMSRARSVEKLKASLRQDLEWLLNTRQIPGGVPSSFHEMENSVYGFGLPDVSAFNANSSRDRGRLIRMLEETIARYEPRLTGVRATLVDSGSNLGRQLRFQIEGLLLMDPAPEHISFDTVLQLASGEYQVKG